MGQWKGLVWKEWIIYKAFFFLWIVINILGILVGPFLIKRFLGVDVDIGIIAIIGSAIWMFLHVMITMLIFISSIERDMKRQDIWFHSPATMYKLVGAKLFSAFVFTFTSLVSVSVITTFAYQLFAKTDIIPLSTVLKIEMGLILAIAFSALSFTIGIFAMWVFSRLLRPINIAFAHITSIVLYFITVNYYSKFIDSDLYKKLAHYLEIELPKMNLGDFSSQNFYMNFEVNNNIFVGEIVFEIVFFTCLFIFSTFVFEKKVRG